MMNGNISKQTDLNNEIHTNQILLLKEKIENLQNIYLRKKLKFQKESFERIKQEKQLNLDYADLKTKNIQITNRIGSCKLDIQSLKDRHQQIKQEGENMSKKINELENKNNKLLEEVRLFFKFFSLKILFITFLILVL